MPKKTRQEKILARLRRLEQEKTAPGEQIEQVVEKIQLPRSDPAGKIAATILTPKAKAVVDYTPVMKDLRKTLVLTCVFLLLEVVLSLTFQNVRIFN